MIQKIYWHVVAIVKIVLYRMMFGKGLEFPFSSTFRERFNLTIVNMGGVNSKVVIGKNVFFNHDCSITCSGSSVTIGDGTIFGENVKIYDHNHRYKDTTIPIKEQGYTSAPVKIGKHCWIASNVVILKGVSIGDNCVIGAGCVIFKDVPDGKVVVNSQNLLMK